MLGLIKKCGRFCTYLGHCMNQHEGECLGYVEPENDDEVEERLDNIAY